MAPALFNLFGTGDEATTPPDLPAKVGANLAARNLRRGVVLGLPSGEAILNAMASEPRNLVSADDYNVLGDNTDLATVKDQVRAAFWNDVAGAPPITPLWRWILAEAQLVTAGAHLGPVGARIVAETSVGLLEADPRSLIRSNPGWTPDPTDYLATIVGG
ncbi:hypothetical protein [Ilumatobacter sp.]|uniref:hypothetical protein n=1 Tax=Ilumatobacter sp. TaxID=1967498 RepID=UPI003B5215DA